MDTNFHEWGDMAGVRLGTVWQLLIIAVWAALSPERGCPSRSAPRDQAGVNNLGRSRLRWQVNFDDIWPDDTLRLGQPRSADGWRNREIQLRPEFNQPHSCSFVVH